MGATERICHKVTLDTDWQENRHTTNLAAASCQRIGVLGERSTHCMAPGNSAQHVEWLLNTTWTSSGYLELKLYKSRVRVVNHIQKHVPDLKACDSPYLCIGHVEALHDHTAALLCAPLLQNICDYNSSTRTGKRFQESAAALLLVPTCTGQNEKQPALVCPSQNCYPIAYLIVHWRAVSS